MPTIVVFVGPAGSGKSSLVAAYSRWLEENESATVAKINLDPAAEYIPYRPDYDVRNIVNAHDIALKLGLGPNGALVKAIEITTQRVNDIVSDLKKFDTDFLLIDTPGQMEVFIFRDLAPVLMKALKSLSDRLVTLFVVDASLVRDYTDYAFLSVLSVAIQLRLDVDVVPILNKIDLVDDLPLVGDVVSDIDKVLENVKTRGTYGEMLSQILNTIWLYAKATRVPRVSATKSIGLDELHRIVHEVTCSCGDLT